MSTMEPHIERALAETTRQWHTEVVVRIPRPTLAEPASYLRDQVASSTAEFVELKYRRVQMSNGSVEWERVRVSAAH